jgi:hypothetical protein
VLAGVDHEGIIALANGVPGLQHLSLATNRWVIPPVEALRLALSMQCWTSLVTLDLTGAQFDSLYVLPTLCMHSAHITCARVC